MKDSFKNYSNNSLLPSFENVLNFSFGKIESFTVLQSFLLHVIHVFISLFYHCCEFTKTF